MTSSVCIQITPISEGMSGANTSKCITWSIWLGSDIVNKEVLPEWILYYYKLFFSLVIHYWVNWPEQSPCDRNDNRSWVGFDEEDMDIGYGTYVMYICSCLALFLVWFSLFLRKEWCEEFWKEMTIAGQNLLIQRKCSVLLFQPRTHRSIFSQIWNIGNPWF